MQNLFTYFLTVSTGMQSKHFRWKCSLSKYSLWRFASSSTIFSSIPRSGYNWCGSRQQWSMIPHNRSVRSCGENLSIDSSISGRSLFSSTLCHLIYIMQRNNDGAQKTCTPSRKRLIPTENQRSTFPDVRVLSDSYHQTNLPL